MQTTLTSRPTNLMEALRQLIRSPIRTIVPPWSWKAAAFSAVVRAIAFFISNLQSGRREATKAMFIEALFAIFGAGLVGAVSQQLRETEPLWATALLVWIGLPGLMLLAQVGVHHVAETPHLNGGLVSSFSTAVVASAFTWFAMRRGAMLGGVDETTIRHDIRALPKILLDFLLAGPRRIITFFGGRRQKQ